MTAQRGVIRGHVFDFLFPAGNVHREQLFEVVGGQVQAGQVERIGGRQVPDGRFLRLARAFGAFANPFEHAAVFAIAGPEPPATAVLAEPVHEINLWQLAAVGALRERKPVREIIAHVVTAEGQHGERIAAQHAGLAERGGGGFRTAG